MLSGTAIASRVIPAVASRTRLSRVSPTSGLCPPSSSSLAHPEPLVRRVLTLGTSHGQPNPPSRVTPPWSRAAAGQAHPRRVRAGLDQESIVVGEATLDPGVVSVHHVRDGEADP